MSALRRESPRKKSQKNSTFPSSSYKSYRKDGIIPKSTLCRWRRKYGNQIPDCLLQQGYDLNKTRPNVSMRMDSDQLGQDQSAASALSFTQTLLQETELVVMTECSGEDIAFSLQPPAEQIEMEQGEEGPQADANNFLHCPSDSAVGSLQEPDEDLQDSSDEEVMVEAAEESTNDDTDDPDMDCDDVCTIPKFKLVPVLLLLKTKIRHGLTYTATASFTNLIQMYCKNIDLTICSKYHLENFVKMYSGTFSIHQLCPDCKTYIGVLVHDASCRKCHAEVHNGKCFGLSFIYLSLKTQIKNLLENEILTEEDFNYCKTRKKQSESAFEDLFDGSLYSKLSEKQMYKTFNFFVDGLQVTSSSKKSAWPVLCTLNELPPTKRRKHILMSSLWLGQDKPNCNEYLRPFVNECIELATVGVDYVIKGTKRNLKFRAAMCIADSVARPAIRNSTLFSGNFGCGLCVHPGEWTLKGKGGMMSYSPCHEEHWTGEKNPVWYARRTHAQTMLDAEEAETSHVIQRGIVSKSILTRMPWFDIIDYLDGDIMHIIMNVGKTFCKLWFKTKNDGKPFYIKDKMNQVSTRLKSFHPTSEVSRAPRSLDYYSDYKAHEWSAFILIYSLLALKGILPSKYFEHWALLVSALGRLTKTSVKVCEVYLSKRELEQFVADTHTLYGMNCVTFNVHLLSHLPQSVQHFGNLWTHSAFLYESYNSVLKNSVRSSNGIVNQIVMEFQTRAAVQFMEADLNNILSTEEKEYLRSLSTSQSKPNITKDLGFVQFFGTVEVRFLENFECYALRREGVVVNHNVSFNFYSRCKFQDLIIQGTSYSRTVKKNNSVVLLTDGNAFIIKTFLHIEKDHNTVYCLGHLLVESNQKICDVSVSHMWSVSVEERFRAVPLHTVVSKLIYLEIPNLKVCCRHPYEMEDLS